MTDNPLLADWGAPFGLPPFSELEPAHFPPAFAAELAAARAAIAEISANPEPPTFANTIEALERSGRGLRRIAACFFNILGACANDALEEVERDIAPRLARFDSELWTNSALFTRVAALSNSADDLDLSSEQRRVLTLYHRDFIRAGAELNAAGRARMTEIATRQATLHAQFAQNLLADEKGWMMPLQDEAEMAGLPPFLLAASAAAAQERGVDAPGVVTLSRSLIEPFLAYSTRRDLRERAYQAWISRGMGGDATDNRALVRELLALRREQALLLGFEDFAAFRLDSEMAKTPAAAAELLQRVWRVAARRAGEEAEALQALIAADGENFTLAAWDWRFYAEKMRRRRYALDEAETKPYLALDRVRAAAFECATRLFGVSFLRIDDAPAYHPDVDAWEVRRGDAHIGVLLTDYFARPSKRSGAWMSDFRAQSSFDGEIRPIIVNVANFAKSSDGPSLLTLDDARTLFHEFGHALHGLLSNVAYPYVSGTSVARDFVELPSQLYVRWLTTPEILSGYARHVETGAPMPEELIARVKAAENFNQGFATVEYVASALVDLALHRAEDASDPVEIEIATLTEIGMPAAIGPRHRAMHFAHLFAGDGYAASYYSYMWSEVLDSDAFEAFREAGDVFDPGVAARLCKHIYAAGGSADPEQLYFAFRGSMPGVEALLKERGLDVT